MTKICIVEVELNRPVDEIISNALSEISGEAKKQLTQSIDMAKSIQALKESKKAAKQENIDKFQLIINQLYDEIIKAGVTGVPQTHIESIISNNMTMSGFTLRMKTHLRKDGNKYALLKENRAGKPHYLFVDYNQ